MKCSLEVFPTIVFDEGTSGLITNTELKGSSAFPTCGVVINRATCIIKESYFEGFQKGGIMMLTDKENENNLVKVFTSIIRNCGHAGIQILGNNDSVLIEDNNIDFNTGPGIQVCTGGSPRIQKNIINNNTEGIEVINGDPVITRNTITRNEKNGILTKSMMSLLCNPLIDNNTINSNRYFS